MTARNSIGKELWF